MKTLKEITHLHSGAVHASIHSDDSQIGGVMPVISDPAPSPDYFPDNLEEKTVADYPEILLHQNLAQHYTNFDKADKADIKAYKNGSRRINGNLWNRYHGKTQEQHSRIGGLDLALKKHGAPRDLTVYSGTRHDPLEHMNREGIVHHPAYLSTSLKENTAKGFASSFIKKPSGLEVNPTRNVLKIRVPKGHPGAYIEHLSNKGEHEFVLPRGLNLKHTKTTRKMEHHPIYGNLVTKTHHMQIVGSEPEARHKNADLNRKKAEMQAYYKSLKY